ncbi:TetR/AcrR family transcriptional regulator [Cytobacillus depressus]|uniref:TetR/AcrR family transcriptional regulator n=1 Tax=Cytobacillus depressus TaxID=1602942 RepID=A0A6L3VCC0_9BACI|nr:TetR/AcrR family transcriptional regulator [Cytobacillus depressus]KAB2336823.1 TetR/AcrR family transcriptional regulator [Cytobacillus depressus]
MDRASKRKRTKQLLLDATKELVREKGCSKMTLNDIIERTRLSKGAIYHYVKSKDELLAIVLEERLEDINDSFFAEVNKGNKELEGPLQETLKKLPSLQDPLDPTNRIFIYLLGKNDQPAVSEMIRRFYEQAIQFSKQWIVAGQKAGVISLTVDADKIAELFVLISYGVRMRSAISSDSYAFGPDDFSNFIADLLRSKKNNEKRM